MRITQALILLILNLISFESIGRTVILDCVWGDKPIEQYDEATAIVVATVVSISVKNTGSQFPSRTILWLVKESWKGPHYKGSNFTTRERMYAEMSAWPLTPGRSMLLYMRGKEPYEIDSPMCGTTGYLEDSIPKLQDLFQLRKDWGQ